MDAHRTASVSRVYVPNQYTVWLGREDYERLSGYESGLAQELSGYLLEHARRHDYALLTRPEVRIERDERLRLGEFGIQTRMVKPPARQGEGPVQGEEGHTMVYSAPPKQAKPARPRPELPETRAVISLDDRRYVLEGPVAVVGRSRECDLVLDDPNVSRRHAELRRNRSGDWTIVDLGSTNGIKVNGRPVDSSRPWPGAGRYPMVDSDPIAVALKFGFLAVLYLFLFWVARSALRELRATSAPAPEPTGFHAIGPGGGPAPTDAWLVGVRGGIAPGERIDLFGGVTIGRAPEADVTIDDRFASGVHARVYSRGPLYFVEDLGSTNGTFVNGARVDGEMQLRDLDELRIGDTELRFEVDVPGGA